MHYLVTCERPNLRYLNFELTIDHISEGILHLQLPSWRPGRYELGNFAKNVQGFRAYGPDGDLKWRKLTKDLWELKTGGLSQVKVSYNYYSAELNAGSTYVDE